MEDGILVQEKNGKLVRRQSCPGRVPISTRYAPTRVVTYTVSYSSETPEEPSTTSTTSRRFGPFTLNTSRLVFTPRLPTTTSTRSPWTLKPPSKKTLAVEPRAANGVPITITKVVEDQVPIETIYSCPEESSDPPTSSREPPTSSSRPPPTSSSRPPPTSSSSWEPSSRPPPSPSTRPTSSIPPPTSSWPPTTTTTIHEPTTTPRPSTSSTSSWSSSISWPCSSYIPRLESWAYGDWCLSTSSDTNCYSWIGEYERIPVPCTSSWNSTSSTSNRTSSVPPATSWPCSSYNSRWEEWVGVPCTSTFNTTSSLPPTTSWPCSTYVNQLETWVGIPCTSSTTNITTPPPTSTWPCSSYVPYLESWVSVNCTSSVNSTTPTATSSIPMCSSYIPEWEWYTTYPCTTTSNTTTPSSTYSITSSTRSITSNTHNVTSTTDSDTSRTRSTETITPPTSRSTTASSTVSACSTFDWDLDDWVPCTETSATSWATSIASGNITSQTSHTSYTDSTSRSTNPTSRPTDSTSRPTESESSRPITLSSTRSVQVLIPSNTHTPTNSHTRASTDTEEASTQGVLGSPTTRTTHSNPSLGTTQPQGSSEPNSPTSRGPPSARPTSQPGPQSSHEQSPQPSSRLQQTTRPTPEPSTRPTPQPTPQPTTPQPTLTPSNSMISFSQPSVSQMMTSAFLVPSGTAAAIIPPPSNTITTLPQGGLHGGALAGAIVGGILGAVGLLGIGVFLMRAFSGANHAADLFSAHGGGYERTSGGDGGGGGGHGDMQEVRNEGPERRSSLRNRLMPGGYDNGAPSWAGYAFAGAAAGALASNQQHRRGQESNASNANARYADGGIRDEDTPDGHPAQMRYADGGLAGPDSRYDTGAQGPATHQYMQGGDGYFEPYRDLPTDDGVVGGVVGQAVGGNGTGGAQPGGPGGQVGSGGGGYGLGGSGGLAGPGGPNAPNTAGPGASMGSNAPVTSGGTTTSDGPTTYGNLAASAGGPASSGGPGGLGGPAASGGSAISGVPTASGNLVASGNPAVTSGNLAVVHGDGITGFVGSTSADGGFGADQPSSQHPQVGQQNAPGGAGALGGQDYPLAGPFDDLPPSSPVHPSLNDSASGGAGTDGTYQQQQHGQVPYWDDDDTQPAPGYEAHQPHLDLPGELGTGTGSSLPQWSLLDELELGQSPNSAGAEGSTSLTGPGMADPPKGVHRALERAGTIASTRARGNSRGQSPFYMAGEVGAAVKPLRVAGKVAGPREKPPSVKALSPVSPGGGPSVLPPYAEEQ